MNTPLLWAKTDLLHRKVLQTPGESTLKERVQRKATALHSPLYRVPSPTKMKDVGESGTSQTTLMLHELTCKPG